MVSAFLDILFLIRKLVSTGAERFCRKLATKAVGLMQVLQCKLRGKSTYFICEDEFRAHEIHPPWLAIPFQPLLTSSPNALPDLNLTTVFAAISISFPV